jgi:hypothetical protein
MSQEIIADRMKFEFGVIGFLLSAVSYSETSLAKEGCFGIADN